MTTPLDTLVVALEADLRPIDDALAGLDRSLQAAEARGTDRWTGLSAAGTAALDEVETALAGLIETGRLSFDDLEGVAQAAFQAIADAASRHLAGLFEGLLGNDAGDLAGLLAEGAGSIIGTVFGGLAGIAGRAHGGPVAPGRPYWVGEQGPELLIPRGAGDIVPASGVGAGSAGAPAPVTVHVTGVTDRDALRRSGTQVARQVRLAMLRAERDR